MKEPGGVVFVLLAEGQVTGELPCFVFALVTFHCLRGLQVHLKHEGSTAGDSHDYRHKQAPHGLSSHLVSLVHPEPPPGALYKRRSRA